MFAEKLLLSISGKSGYLDIYAHNKCISKTANLYNLGSCSLLYIRELIPSLTGNQYYTQFGNVTVTCGNYTFNLFQFQMQGMEIGSTVRKLVDDDEVIGWGRDLLDI